MHAMELDGKVAVVTGGARRVGRAIAEELARAGAEVVIHFNAARAEAESVAAGIPGALIVQADLSTPTGCAQLTDRAVAERGRIDLLVNSAAGYRRGAFADQGDEVWQEMLSLNLIAPARLIRLALPHRLSSVVNIVDVAAWQAWRNHAAYASSKAGLLQLTRDLALELAPGVRVNAVAPGTVAFPPDFTDGERAAVTSRIPLARIGAPTDVARAVRFLAGEPFLTGAVIPVDGGAALR
jgi:pteridine reductase